MGDSLRRVAVSPRRSHLPYALCLLIFPFSPFSLFPLFSPYRYAPCAEQSESQLQRTTDNWLLTSMLFKKGPANHTSCGKGA